MAAAAVILEGRAVLAIDGPDRASFLQGIVSNDVTKAGEEHAIWTAFLTPQGKFLHEFFLLEWGEVLFLDCEAGRREDLQRRLARYKLRAKANIRDASEAYLIAAAVGDGVLATLGLESAQPGEIIEIGGGRAYVDPRLAALGARLILPRSTALATLKDLFGEAAPLDTYDRVRLALGVPDGSHDLEVEKSVLLESGFDELNGLDWNKGCYLGQEVTARTKYRGLVKKRLLPVTIDGPTPAPGTAVTAGDREVGVMRSAVSGLGLALLRLDSIGSDAGLTAGKAAITPQIPNWLAAHTKPPQKTH